MTAPKIMPVTQCKAVSSCMASPSSYASRLSSYAKPTAKAVAALALRELEAARQKDIETHAANAPALEANAAIVEQVTAMMNAVGMPTKYSERDPKSRARYPKSITHDAGYLIDLRRHCPTTDGFDWATTTYERLLKDYKAFEERGEKEAEEAKRQAEIEANREIERRKADMELAAILLRYQLPIESSWGDVLENLRARDQRLDLAVGMAQTRGDWSEGPYRVRSAFDRFTIHTTEDKAIANDVLSCLEDFEDGRVFRDTTWSYSRLFAEAADQQLSQDVQTAMARDSSY